MFAGRSVLLGVGGSIAAYKAAELCRMFVKGGAQVRVAMTPGACRFIAPMSFAALSGREVLADLFSLTAEARIGHIAAAKEAEVFVIAPASASLLARMAAGIADDYPTTVYLAATCPVLVAPAMNANMYAHPATRANLETLAARGVRVIEPGAGALACGDEGPGRLAESAAILHETKRALTPQSFAGRRVVVTAGPTWEPLDPVRFLTNPSTGKMGYALAQAAWHRGAEVHLVSGPAHVPPPRGVVMHPVRTAIEMRDAVLSLSAGCDAVLMAAAVSDFRPFETAPRKVKKEEGALSLALARNPDILAELGAARGPGQVLVGFAAETDNLVKNARGKLSRKHMDLVVANDLTRSGAGFACDTNAVTILDAEGGAQEVLGEKTAVAEAILDRVETIFLAGGGP